MQFEYSHHPLIGRMPAVPPMQVAVAHTASLCRSCLSLSGLGRLCKHVEPGMSFVTPPHGGPHLQCRP